MTLTSGSTPTRSAASKEFSTSSRTDVYSDLAGVSNPAIVLFSAKNSAGLFCWDTLDARTISTLPTHPPTPLRSARLRTDRQPRAPFPFAGLCLFFFCLFLVFPREKPEKLDAVFLEPSSLLDAGGGAQRWRPARALALSDAAERGDPIGTTTSSPVDPFAFGPVVTFPCGRLAPTLLVRRAGAPALQKYERAGFVDAKRRPRVRGVGERGVRPRSVQARA